MTGDASLGTAAGPAGRVGTSLPELVDHVAGEYRLGDVGDWSVIATGYEDCNIDLRAERARVVIKVFAAGRPAGIAARTAGIIADVTAAGVRHPRLHADAAGGDVHAYDGHRLLVMDFAPGQTFYDLGRPLETGMPQAADHPQFRMTLSRRHGDLMRADGSSGGAGADVPVRSDVPVCSGAASSSASSHARSADLRADRRCAASARSPARTASRTATRSSSIRRSSASMVSATGLIIPAGRCDFQQSPAWETLRRAAGAGPTHALGQGVP